MVEAVAQRGLDQARGFRAGQFFLRLALELRVAQEQGEFGGERPKHVIRRHLGGATVATVLAPGAHAFQQRAAEAAFVRAAERCRHGVAVEVQEPFAVLQAGQRPFEAPGALAVGARGQVGLAGPDRQHAGGALDVGGEAVAQSAGEMQHRLRRCLVLRGDQRGIARPADFHAAEQIRLRAAEPIQPRRAERGIAENLAVGPEADQRAATVLHRAGVDELGRRLAAHVALAPQHAVARDLDVQRLGERVDHGTADAVQAAGGLIDLAAEFPAGMQGREDHFQRAQVAEFRVRIDRDAAAVVADGEAVVGFERDIDEAGMAGDGLVHRVVENFGGEVVQGGLVGAADIHAGTAPHRLQPLQHFDIFCRVGRRVAVLCGFGARRRGRGAPRARRWGTAAEQVVVHAVFLCSGGTLASAPDARQAAKPDGASAANATRGTTPIWPGRDRPP